MTATGRVAVMVDVARLAGVSHQTVSRVLNGHPHVAAATRERVLTAMRTLDYRPNAPARWLAGRRSRMIGVISDGGELYGPTRTLLAIERAARAAGYGVSIVTLDRTGHRAVLAAVGVLADQCVAGVIVIAPRSAAAAALHRLPQGMVGVGVESDAGGAVPAVSVDQATGARLVVRHLLDLGHRTVWHVTGPPDSLDARRRVKGWRAVLTRAGAEAPPPLPGDWTAASGYRAGQALAGPALARCATAVFAGNDQMAVGLLRAFAERGLRVPGDVSVAGFDDIPEAAYLTPPLTTVRQDLDAVGRRCVATLLAAVHGSTAPPPDPVVRPALVVRHSTTSPS
jgi:LacI family transcriptional regulator